LTTATTERFEDLIAAAIGDDGAGMREALEALDRAPALSSMSFPVFVKAAPSEASDGKMRIEMEASNPSWDMDGQKVLPEGLILDYFLKAGKILYGHAPPGERVHPKCVIGEPVDAKITKERFWMVADLFPWKEYAKEIYADLTRISGNEPKGAAPKRVIWAPSFEGNAISYDPKDRRIVSSAFVRNVVIDYNVKNIKCWAKLAKAFAESGGSGGIAMSNPDIAALQPEEIGRGRGGRRRGMKTGPRDGSGPLGGTSLCSKACMGAAVGDEEEPRMRAAKALAHLINKHGITRDVAAKAVAELINRGGLLRGR